jgi:hypothetical protein
VIAGTATRYAIGRRDLVGMIGWQLASHMRTDLVLDALRMGARDPSARC